MTERAEPVSEQEKHFQSLKQDIVSVLLKRGAVQGSPAKALGREIITIVEDRWEEFGVYQALLLDVDGNWHGRQNEIPWDVDGNFDSVLRVYARLADPHGKAIERNYKPEEESFNEGFDRRRQELKDYVGENKTSLADGLINNMKGRLEELNAENLSWEEKPQVTWKEYDSWRASLTREQRIMGGHMASGLKEKRKFWLT